MEPRNRLNEVENEVNERISHVRDRGERLTDRFITLSHGAGGKASAALVEHIFLAGYGNQVLDELDDAAVVGLAELVGGSDDLAGARLAFTTDSYVVSPIRFPGGSIGDLAINGTVNDLAVSGAVPQLISAAFVLEEGLSIDVLREVVAEMRAAAETAGVRIVTGDTKVVPRGAADQLYITTAGVGLVPAGRRLGASLVQRGDRLICSGAIADHGMSVMLARGDLAIDAPIVSDTRAVNGLVAALLGAAPHTRWLRDVTRGGLGTVLNELAQATRHGVVDRRRGGPGARDDPGSLRHARHRPALRGQRGRLRGRGASSRGRRRGGGTARRCPAARRPAVIGRIVAEPASSVVLVTGFGGTRMVDMLVGDPLPRIC